MLFIVLPALNEGAALKELLPAIDQALQGHAYRVLVIDDGSSDDTAAVAESFAAVTLLRHGQNKGLGEALRTGFLKALELGSENDIIVTMDADNTHWPGIVPSMAERIAAGFDVVAASRFAAGGGEVGLALHRRLLSRGAAFLMGLFFPLQGITDYSSGYRAYRAGFLAKGFAHYGPSLIESKSFAVSVEVLLKLSLLQPDCTEVPLLLRYDLKQGKSKMPVLRTVLGYLSLIFRLKRAGVPEAEVEV